MASFEFFQEKIKQELGVNRAGSVLGMELDRHKGQAFMSDTLVGAIVDVGEPGLPTLGKRGRVHGKSVILGGDVAAFASLFEAGLILASMTVFELVGVTAGCQGQDLVAQADPEGGYFLFDTLSNRGDGRVAHFRIPWAVGDQDSFKIKVEKIIVTGNSDDLTVSLNEAA